MDGADEGRGAVGGNRCRLNGDGAATIWHNGQARPRGGAVQDTLYTFERRGLSRFERRDREVIQGADLEGGERGRGWQMFICVLGIHCLQRRLQAAVRCRSVALVGSLRSNCDKVRDLGRFLGVAPPGRPFIEHGLEIWVQSFPAPPGHAEVFYCQSENAGWQTQVFFQYLVLPFGWSQSGYWFSRLVQRFWTTVKRRYGYRVLSQVSRSACFCRGLQKGIEVARSLASKVWTESPAREGRVGQGIPVLAAPGVYDRYEERALRSSRQEVGRCVGDGAQAARTSKDESEGFSHGQVRELDREVPKFEIGSTGHCFSSPRALRLRAEAQPRSWDCFRFHWSSVPGKSYDAFVSCSSARPAVLEEPSKTAAPPAHLAQGVGTDLHSAHRRNYDSARRDVEPRCAFGWDTKLVRDSWLLGRISSRSGSHHDVAVDDSASRVERVSQPLRAEGERDHSIVDRPSGGDVDSESMGIEVSGIDGRVTTASSPLPTPRFDFRYSPPPLSAESLRPTASRGGDAWSTTCRPWKERPTTGGWETASTTSSSIGARSSC
jgi:hypothetical protein